MGDDTAGYSQHSAYRKAAEILSFRNEQQSKKHDRGSFKKRAGTAAKDCFVGKAISLGKTAGRRPGYYDQYCRKAAGN